MTKDVMVTISGLQMADGDEDAVEMVHIGEYYERNGTFYVLFDERMEGMPVPVKNIIKIKPRSIEVQKKGPVAAQMLFEEGKSQSSTYTVPYGSFLLKTCTTGVYVRSSQDELEATASYGLHINGTHCADCDIRVLVQSKETFRLSE